MTNIFEKVHVCATCQVEKGYGTCSACLFTRQLQKYQSHLKLKRDANGKTQVVPASEAEDGTPFRRLFRKVGRNEPCPCGVTVDGKPKKFKHCCGRPADLPERAEPKTISALDPEVLSRQAFDELVQSVTKEIRAATVPQEPTHAEPDRPSDAAGPSGQCDQGLPAVPVGDVREGDPADHHHGSAP